VIENLEGLLIFTRVVEKKSFTAAAQDLRMSPSAVSKHITRLEGNLGVRLINRSTHQLSLTEYGTTLYRRCSRIFVDLADAEMAVKALTHGLKGTLRIHSTPRVGERLISPALVAFMQEHDDLSVELTMRPELVNPIECGFDIAIRSGTSRDVGLKHSSLGYREYGPIRYFICAAPAYFRKYGTPTEPRDLTRHNCLIHVTQSSASVWEFEDGDGEYSIEVTGSVVSNNHMTVYEAARAGLGIGRFLEYEVGEALQDGSLTVLFAGVTKTDRLIRAFYPMADMLPDKVQQFLDFLELRLAWTAVGGTSTGDRRQRQHGA
jgi:DNA-binding transcriptional LysR family regulator